MKIKVIKQRDAVACGPTCIKMASDYFNTGYTYKQIATITQYKKRGGLTNEQIASALKQAGLKTAVKKNSDWQDLKKNNIPEKVIIVCWMLKGYIGHVSVVEKVTQSHIYLADPEAGKIIKMQKLIFLRLWMDYDGLWYPKKNTDIRLRWIVVVSK